MSLRESLACLLLLAASTLAAGAQEIRVATDDGLAAAIENASPGQRIVLAPGTYRVRRIETRIDGLPQRPIVVAAQVAGTVTIEASATEAFKVQHAYWAFEDLEVVGNERTHHAFHVAGEADHFALRRSTLVDFHAHIKANGVPGTGFPDFAQIHDNRLFNNAVRETAEPVTFIDVVGGRGWHIKGNYLADFGKGLGDRVSYGLFLKGNSRQGLIEQNLVLCSRSTMGGTRVGVSLGGGGSKASLCEDEDCTSEHREGVIRNNVIVNCSDAGVYLNRASDSTVAYNTLLYTTGVDVRFPTSSAVIANNIVSGGVRERDGGQLYERSNLTTGTSFGMYLPGAAAKLKHRISDYDSKFPSLFDADDVAAWQRRIGSLFRFLEGFGFGLGLDRQEEMFPDFLMGNLRPSTEWLERIVRTDDYSDVETDFWGRARARQPHVLGAIDYLVSPCDLRARLEGSGADDAPPCLADFP